MKLAKSEKQLLDRLRAVLDRPKGRYRELNGAKNLGEYLGRDRSREDEELLTEPILGDLLERLLGFPSDAYFPQLGRGGLKPDFTPHDLVAHRFVFDAKSSTQDLDPHEAQIRRYIDQRQLDYGVLFNLRELRVYQRGKKGHDAGRSFSLLHLWEIAHEQALPDEDAIRRLTDFIERFHHRALGTTEKIDLIRGARSWSEREGRGETVEIDLDFLVDRLRDLSRELQADAAAQRESLERTLKLQPGRERSLLRELELIALDLSPGFDLAELPRSVSGYADADELPGRVWRQYLLRVSQLALTRIMLYRSREDVEFVDSYLYDGGFEQWYDQLNQDLQRVLREAYHEGHSLTSMVRRTERPARLEQFAELDGAIGELAKDFGVRASVGVPIIVDGRLWGVTVAIWQGDASPPPDTEARMSQFAGLLDTAIANADSRDQLTASRARLVTAGDEARRRVVRDLHDGAQQRLVHTIVTLKLAQRSFRDRDGKAESLLGEALEQAERGNAELRELAHGILPAVLTRGGLRAGVDAVVNRIDIPVAVNVPAERLQTEIEASAYFILAEALTNVVKHSNAESARVRASVEDGVLQVEVRDDGIGGADPDSHGLVGMADRVSALGGRLSVQSPAGGGTVVTATLPLPAA